MFWPEVETAFCDVGGACYKQVEGSVDDGSVRSDGEVEYVEGDQDDAYWDDDVDSPTPRPPSTGGVANKKLGMSRLRSFDQAAAGRGAPVLRKAMSHRVTRVPSNKSPKPPQKM